MPLCSPQAVGAIWLGTLCLTLGHVAEEYLSPAMDALAQNLSLPPRLAGVTLLAWANGAPDISANIAAMRSGKTNMALGSAIGAGLFVTCLVVGRLTKLARSLPVKGATVRRSQALMHACSRE
jgi:Ca2+/Na+ antiporter